MNRRTVAILGGLLLVALLLDAIFYTGYFASDDQSYLRAARAIANGGDLAHWKWTSSIANTRLFVTGPDGIVYGLTGGNVAAIAWFHTAYHLALVLLAFAIGQEVADRAVGVGAAAVVAVNPIFYVYAGAVLPDNAAAVWLAVLLLLLLRARRAGALDLRQSARRYLTAGLVLGACYSCKETGLIMAVPCAAVIMASAPSLRSPVWVRDGAFLAGGLVVFVLLEALALRAFSGEWISRLGGVEDSGDVFLEKMSAQGTAPWDRLYYAFARRLLHVAPVITVALVLAALAMPFLRGRRDLALLAFFWWPLLYLIVGSTSFTAYRPPSIQARYFAICIVPAAVILAVVVRAIVERWPLRGWAVRGFALALVVATAIEVRHDIRNAGNIYRAVWARGAIAGIERARAQYPQYPAVLCDAYRRRVSPMLFPRAPDGVYADRATSDWDPPPAPPFVLISDTESAPPDGVGDLPDLRLSGVRIETLEIVYPSRRRLDDTLHGLFGGEPPPRANRGAAVLQLVTVL